MRADSKSLSRSEFMKRMKEATPEARFKRHEAWMSANKDNLERNVFWILRDLRKLLKNPKGVCSNAKLILALLKVLDSFKQLVDIYPDAVKGVRFAPGRDKDAVGEIRNFIRTKFKKSPLVTNAQLWDAISKKPPKGWREINSPRLGIYLEGPPKVNGDIQYVKYASFCNAAAKERRLLKV